MTKLLTLEASSETCSVTLLTPDISKTVESQKARSHSQLLLPFVDQLLHSNGLLLSDLDFVACSMGPGSFTGLRICFSVSQGLAFGLDIPMVMVCSLESMAFLCAEEHPSVDDKPHIIITVMDARMDQVYWAIFKGEHTEQGAMLETEASPRLQFVSEAGAQIEQFLFRNPNTRVSVVGNGYILLQSLGFSFDDALSDAKIMPTSRASSKLALYKWVQGLSVSAEEAELVYLRDTVSWKKRTRIRAQ